MVCPNCGREIEEGSLFCANCFADIRIVPTYDSKVEEAVNEVLEDVGKRVERETNREKMRVVRSHEVERKRRKIGLVLIGMVTGILVATLVLLLYNVLGSRSESYYVARAYDLANAGNYDGAVEVINEAITLGDHESAGIELLLTRAEYEARAGEEETAMRTLQDILATATDTADIRSAYSRIIEIYSAQGEYATIARILRDCGNEEVQNSFRQYMIFLPQFSLPSGTYEEDLSVVLSAEGDGSIFYTLDGSRPTTSSSLYTGAIPLTPGITRVTAVYINRFGVMSRSVSRLYMAPQEDGAPDAPIVMPEGGTYSEDIRVTVDVPADTVCYYTTDGTDPSVKSTPYEDPIPVPVGTTDYRFVLISESGARSEVTEVIYTRTATASVTEADGPAIIIQALIGLGEPMTADGTVENGLARFVYVSQGRQTLYGKEYYTYIELMQDTTGNSVHTGRSFAVDVADGTANYIDENANIAPIG